MIVASGGTNIGVALGSGALAIVSAGGKDIGATVGSGATALILFNGTQVSATIGRGGTAIVSAGGTALAVLDAGGELDVRGLASGGAIASGVLTIFSGGTTSATVVASGGTLVVSSGGMANAATISSGAARSSAHEVLTRAGGSPAVRSL